jgi:hypothetical protein
MNVTFNLPTPELEKRFIAEAAPLGMEGIKGHRSVGGCEPIYNAFPAEGVERRRLMQDFEKRLRFFNVFAGEIRALRSNIIRPPSGWTAHPANAGLLAQ